MGSTVSSRSKTEDKDLRPFFTALVNFMQHDQLECAKHLVKKLSKKDRAAVSRLRDDEDEMTLLFYAAFHGQTSFVNLLLNDCCAEIEKRCVYIQGECEWMTPLCCAVEEGHYEVVKTLVQHGADVNALSGINPDESVMDESAEYRTIVHHAVCKANSTNEMDIVRFLVEKGADINKPNSNGTTCLMDSVNNVELCHFLIHQCDSAGLNAVDDNGETALHAAIFKASFDRVKLLIEHGADPSICDMCGDDALQNAAIYKVPQILEYLIQEIKPTPQKSADAYSLLAAFMTLQSFRPADDPLPYWIKSINIRTEEECTTDVVGPNAAFNFAIEAKDIPSLKKIAKDDDAMNMNALMVLHRILGPNHHETYFQMWVCVHRYAALCAYHRCIDLLRYVYFTSPVSYIKFTLEEICWAFSKMSSQDPTSIRFVDVYDILEMVVEKIRMRHPCANFSPIVLPSCLIYLIDLLLCSTSTDDETSLGTQIVHNLVQARLRTQDGCTLLHTAILPANFCLQFGGHSNEIHVAMTTARNCAVAECLLTAGAAVNAVNSDGNTPLHLAVLDRPTDEETREDWEKMIEILLHHGAHIDMANAKGEVVHDKLPATIDVFKHVSLKCLAARAVRAYQLPYRGIVPGTLADFVDMHYSHE